MWDSATTIEEKPLREFWFRVRDTWRHEHLNAESVTSNRRRIGAPVSPLTLPHLRALSTSYEREFSLISSPIKGAQSSNPGGSFCLSRCDDPSMCLFSIGSTTHAIYPGCCLLCCGVWVKVDQSRSELQSMLIIWDKR